MPKRAAGAVADMGTQPRVAFTRHIHDVFGEIPRDLFYAPLNGSINLVNYKGLLYRSGALKNSAVKVGAISSNNPVGQAIQAAGTIALPGNISPGTNPVRSAVTRAITPGGGRSTNLPSGKPERGYRCPEGFQFGGRFTDENYLTCGKQLFDIPGFRETLSQAIFRTQAQRAGKARPSGAGPRATAEVNVLDGQTPSSDVKLMISRAANVPRVGEGDDTQRAAGVRKAVEALTNQDEAASVLVRRDGYLMVPVVPDGELRGVPDNRNMEGAAYIRSVRTPDAIGLDELGFLSNTGVTSLVYVAPNGVTLRLDRTRDLETGERRQLGKDVNVAADMDVENDPGARLKFIADKSEGAFKFSADFGDMKDPEADEDGKPRWAVQAFDNAPEPKTEELVDLGQVPTADGGVARRVAPDSKERISSVKEAVEHINKGGLLADIDPAIVLQALKQSNRYKPQKLRDDITLYETEDGQRLLVKENNERFEHISAHFSSDVLRELGVQAPTVKFAGTEDDRPFIYRSPDGVIEGGELDPSIQTDDLPDESILGIQVADWLSDTRDRSAASVLGVRVGDDVEAVATIGPLSALVGLTAEELEERRNIGPEDFFQATTDSYGRTYDDLADEQRRLILQVVDSLLARAREFSFADYREKLSLDGNISTGEQRHLSIVERIFRERLDQLTSSRDAILRVLGLGQ